ncbi:MAG: hypothetical protein U0271_08195 [Polyangiaceae bacterium]
MSNAPSPAVPRWKYWHPLPFWQVFVYFLVAGILANLFVAFLRNVLQLPIPAASGGGIGGLCGVLWTFHARQKALQKSEPSAQVNTPLG